MLKVGDIVPCYADWNSANPILIDYYGKLIELLEDNVDYELIYDEMPENKQIVYYKQTWLVEIGTRKEIVYKHTIPEKQINSQRSIRNFAVLKQIGIHSKTDGNQNEEIRNKYMMTENSIAKIKNIITHDTDIIVLDKDDMSRIYNMNSTEFVYKPVLLDKRIRHLVNNEEFTFNSLMNITFNTINCEDECPLKWKPKYLHQAQIMYKVITGKNLNIDLCELKKIILK